MPMDDGEYVSVRSEEYAEPVEVERPMPPTSERVRREIEQYGIGGALELSLVRAESACGLSEGAEPRSLLEHWARLVVAGADPEDAAKKVRGG